MKLNIFKKIQKFKNNRKGFSLIEISVVILIIGVLIAGISQAYDMIDDAALKGARSLSKSSRVGRVKDLVLWLDVTAEGSPLTSANKQAVDADLVAFLKDSNPRSSNRLTLTTANSANYPTYNANKMGGLPGLYFNPTSTGDYLKLTDRFDNSTGEYTIYLVYQPVVIPTSGSNVIMEKRSASGLVFPYKLEIESTGFYKFSDSNAFVYGAKKASNGKVNLIRFSRSSAGALTILVDDVSSTVAGSSTSVINSDELIIGAQNATAISNYANGRIGELVIFERDLKLTEENDIETYLYKKWKLEKDSTKTTGCTVTGPANALIGSTIAVGSNISVACVPGYISTVLGTCTAAPALAYSYTGTCTQGCLISSAIFTTSSTIAVGASGVIATCKNGGTTRSVACPSAGNPTYSPPCP